MSITLQLFNELSRENSISYVVSLIAGAIILAIIFVIVIHIYFAFVFMTIAKRTKTPNAWLAWIPFANIFLLANIAKQQWWMALITVIAFFVPFIGVFVSMAILAYLFYRIAEVLHKPGWIGILCIVPVVNFIALGYLAWSK